MEGSGDERMGKGIGLTWLGGKLKLESAVRKRLAQFNPFHEVSRRFYHEVSRRFYHEVSRRFHHEVSRRFYNPLCLYVNPLALERA